MSSNILKYVFILSAITKVIVPNSIPVRVNLVSPVFQDLSNSKYPVSFKNHSQEYRLAPASKTQGLYGILHYTTHQELSDKNDLLISMDKKTLNRYDYKVEVPQLGRLIYVNPDSGNPVVLDQVDSDKPSFTWSLTKYYDMDMYQGKSLLENLSGKEFKYMTLIGDVYTNIEISKVGDGKSLWQIEAMRSTAPIRKMVSRSNKFQHIF